MKCSETDSLDLQVRAGQCVVTYNADIIWFLLYSFRGSVCVCLRVCACVCSYPYEARVKKAQYYSMILTTFQHLLKYSFT